MSVLILGQGAPPDGFTAVPVDAKNAGTGGVGLVATPSKVNVNLQFKSLTAGAGVEVTDVPLTQNVEIAVSNPVSSDDVAALAGTEGTPSDTNRFVTSDDTRLDFAPQKSVSVGDQVVSSATYAAVPTVDLVLSGLLSLVTVNAVLESAATDTVGLAMFLGATMVPGSEQVVTATAGQRIPYCNTVQVDHTDGDTVSLKVYTALGGSLTLYEPAIHSLRFRFSA